MGRLKGRGIQPRLSGSYRRIEGQPPSVDELRASSDHRKLYKTARWKRLRRQVLERAQWTCEQTGVLLIGRPNQPNSAVVDHKVPHRGDETLFFDPSNLQAVSKAWHDSEKQRRERRQSPPPPRG